MSYLFTVKGPSPAGAWPWPIGTAERAILRQELLACCRAGLATASRRLDLPAPISTADDMDAFFCRYAKRPLAIDRHGCGFNDSLWLWLIARWLLPEAVVESGTFMGYSAWLFRQACPAARIVTHDVELPLAGRLRARAVDYRLQDWSTASLEGIDPKRALCFFDDHISHFLRLHQAHQRGFHLVLLDDNFPARQLHATGAPPLPSLAMLEDEESLTRTLEWQRKGKHYTYHGAQENAREHALVKQIVKACYRFPDLAAITRLPPGSNLTLVRLSV